MIGFIYVSIMVLVITCIIAIDYKSYLQQHWNLELKDI